MGKLTPFLADPDKWRAYLARRSEPQGDCLEWQGAKVKAGYGHSNAGFNGRREMLGMPPATIATGLWLRRQQP